MSKIYDWDMSTGTLPTGITVATSGTASGSFKTGGLFPSSVKYYNLSNTGAGGVKLTIDLTNATLGLGGPLTTAGCGCRMRFNSISPVSGGQAQLFRGQYNSGATTALLIGTASGTVQAAGFYMDSAGTVVASIPSGINFDSAGVVHDLFIGYNCTSGTLAGYATIYIDGIPCGGALITTSGTGTGMNAFVFGSFNLTGTASIDIDGVYITNDCVPNLSILSGSVISGYTAPIAYNVATVQLSSTLGGAAVWAVADPNTASVSSGGLVTLLQAAGAVVDVTDGEVWQRVEFRRRNIVYSASALSGSGPYTSTISAISSDGVTNYADILPSVSPFSGYAYPSSIVGSMASGFTLTIPSLVSGTWQGYIGGALWILTATGAWSQLLGSKTTNQRPNYRNRALEIRQR